MGYAIMTTVIAKHSVNKSASYDEQWNPWHVGGVTAKESPDANANLLGQVLLIVTDLGS